MSAGFSGTYALVPDGWSGKLWGKEMFDFSNDLADPLTYDDGDKLIRPDNHFRTDMGSVPRTLQFVLPRWFNRFRYPCAYIFHDSGYKHGGHWIAEHGGWQFVVMTRKHIDDLLFDMILSEGGSKANARTIWSGVRIGGWASWDK